MLVDISMPMQKGSVFHKGTIPVDISFHTFRNESEGAVNDYSNNGSLYGNTYRSCVSWKRICP